MGDKAQCHNDSGPRHRRRYTCNTCSAPGIQFQRRLQSCASSLTRCVINTPRSKACWCVMSHNLNYRYTAQGVPASLTADKQSCQFSSTSVQLMMCQASITLHVMSVKSVKVYIFIYNLWCTRPTLTINMQSDSISPTGAKAAT